MAILFRLPQLQEEIEALKDATRAALRRLPAPISADPAGEVIHLISNLHRAFETEVNGTSDKDGLLQKIRPRHQAFRRRLRGTAPRFIPWRQDEVPVREWVEGEGYLQEPIATDSFLDEDERDLGNESVSQVLNLEEVQELAARLPSCYDYALRIWV